MAGFAKNRLKRLYGAKESRLVTWIEFAVVREANKIREIPDYRPEGYRATLRWADAIVSGEQVPSAHSPDELDEEALKWLESRKLR